MRLQMTADTFTGDRSDDGSDAVASRTKNPPEDILWGKIREGVVYLNTGLLPIILTKP